MLMRCICSGIKILCEVQEYIPFRLERGGASCSHQGDLSTQLGRDGSGPAGFALSAAWTEGGEAGSQPHTVTICKTCPNLHLSLPVNFDTIVFR